MNDGLRLVLARHGITDWNREGRFQGHLDPPLSDEGRDEARRLGDRVARSETLRPVRIVSSTLSRAAETAAAMAAAVERAGHRIVIEHDERLIEIGQGEWEGRTHAQLEVEDAERYAAWRSRGSRSGGHLADAQPPGAEPIADARARVRLLLADITRAADAGPICLVSHGGILRIAAGEILGLPEARTWAMDVDNASLSSVVHEDGTWRLECWNDVAHLLGSAVTHAGESEGQPLAL